MRSQWKIFLLACFLVAGNIAGAREGSGAGGSDEAPKVALNGNCAVCAVGGKTVKGNSDHKSLYQGLEYRFPSSEIKKKFDASPEKFAAQYMGVCKVCEVDMGKKMKGDPGIYVVHNKKIYLFANEMAKKKFMQNPSKYTGEKDRGNEGSGRTPPRREGS